jgi:hypothetical protein
VSGLTYSTSNAARAGALAGSAGGTRIRASGDPGALARALAPPRTPVTGAHPDFGLGFGLCLGGLGLLCLANRPRRPARS